MSLLVARLTAERRSICTTGCMVVPMRVALARIVFVVDLGSSPTDLGCMRSLDTCAAVIRNRFGSNRTRSSQLIHLCLKRAHVPDNHLMCYFQHSGVKQRRNCVTRRAVHDSIQLQKKGDEPTARSHSNLKWSLKFNLSILFNVRVTKKVAKQV